MLKSGTRDDRPAMAMIGGLIVALGMMAPPGAPAVEDDPLTGGSAQATSRPKTKHQQFPAWGFSLEKSPVFVFHVVIPFDTMLP